MAQLGTNAYVILRCSGAMGLSRRTGSWQHDSRTYLTIRAGRASILEVFGAGCHTPARFIAEIP